MTKPPPGTINTIVQHALAEDAPWGDLTSEYFLPAGAEVTAELVAREPGVLCGQDVFAAAMRLADPSLRVEFFFADGQHFETSAVLATATGAARGVLQAERVALNFVQRLSGIATMTAAYVAETEGSRARIVDTRKTTPGLRVLERYAVRCGGGGNHRFSLSDAVMVKDNHLAVIGAAYPGKVVEALRTLRAGLSHTTHFEVEVDRLDQIEDVLLAGADTVLLDNFSTGDLHTAVHQIAGRALVEASGNMRLERIREVAATGVNLISVGALTHSVRALDLGLDLNTPA